MSITGNAAQNAQQKLDALKKQWTQNGGVGDYVPPTGSKADYDKLVAAVQQSTAKNESQAALVARIQALGGSVVKLAKTLGVVG